MIRSPSVVIQMGKQTCHMIMDMLANSRKLQKRRGEREKIKMIGEVNEKKIIHLILGKKINK